MIQTRKFDVFGTKYRSTQFPAVRALELFNRKGDVHPMEMLERTEALYGDIWYTLDNREAINNCVVDRVGMLVPLLVLNGVLDIVDGLSFGFLNGWHSVRVPKRFVDNSLSTESANADPVVATLVQQDVATLRELEEYYSLEDAFKLLDIVVAKNVNAALSHEAALKNAKKRP